MLTGLAHVDLACRDVDRSVAFYLAVLGPLGLQVAAGHVRGRAGRDDPLPPLPRGGQRVDRAARRLGRADFALYAPGLHHIAFAVATPDDVRLAHEGAVRAGAEIVHPPTAFPRYHPDYFATFFLDPDGFRVEVRSR